MLETHRHVTAFAMTRFVFLPLVMFVLLALPLFGDSTYCAGADKLTTVQVSTRDELQRAVEGAKPGTKILIAPGT